MAAKREYTLGVAYFLLTAACWSFVAVTVKTLTYAVDPYTISFFRVFLASLVFIALFALRRGSWRRIPWFLPWILVGLLGRTGNYLLYNAGLVYTPSSAATILAPAQQIGVIVCAWWFLREDIRSRWLGLALSAIGLLFIWWNGQSWHLLWDRHYLWGYALLILAGLATSLHFTSQKIMSDRFSGLEILLPVFISSAILTGPFAWSAGGFEIAYSLQTSMLLLFLGMLLTGGSYYFLAEGYRRCDATTGVVITNLGVLLTLVWSHVLLDETVTSIMILGAVFALGGTLAVVGVDRRRLEEAIVNSNGKARYGAPR